ncbi:hypothetical protein K432DRAFT_406744 [Lepidopterella palustris CBS 459.81]|uniref:F-box domain-containing protein n=1 Tax=Lepidopterella palustris CBS 459.81 TaxID=1314670 RepID=A0A8E2E656_9PEZI|nr:hypothetical protein K432DRAFT_406744 [Lepidopterella palustris CBS 459.81]
MAPQPNPSPDLTTLPAELLLYIIDDLRPDDFVTFALAAYPLLRRHGLVPPLSNTMFQQLVNMAPGPTLFPNWPLPIELTDQILRYLSPQDMIWFIFTHRKLFASYIANLSSETVQVLRRACLPD